MPIPYFTLLSIKGERVASKFTKLLWNAEFYDSTGFKHMNADGYMLAPDSEHSPEAAAALASATSADDLRAAVLLDAQRCLAEFEARLVPTLPVDTVSIDLPINHTFRADGSEQPQEN